MKISDNFLENQKLYIISANFIKYTYIYIKKYKRNFICMKK